LAVILTDGVFEAVNEQGEQFGIDRVIDLLRLCRDLPAHETIDRLRDAVVAFAGDLDQADDVTAVIIRKL
jgi:serine phosphatase RsbU (regulator of sigma subunit)